MRYIYFVTILLVSCNGIEKSISGEKIFPLVNDNSSFKVLMSDPSNASESVRKNHPIKIHFNRSIEFSSCIKAFSVLPIMRGQFKEIYMGIEFIPESTWDSGTYSITVTKSCEDLEGNDLDDAYSFYFTGEVQKVPELIPSVVNPAPVVQAMGLESQGCGEKYPGKGSSLGGDWNSPHCFWDSSLPVLQPANYLFRGGDSGDGSVGSNASCVDKTSDNFQIIFSEYMNPVTTPQGVRLKRNSPPASTILLSSWVWKDCKEDSTGGCRVLVLRFSEMESSCNGSLFGTGSTGGDFNLQNTNGYPVGFGVYTISLDANYVQSSLGIKMAKDFFFSVKGN